jgi:Flp pilus assembly protein TadG
LTATGNLKVAVSEAAQLETVPACAETALLASAARTASGNSQTMPYDVKPYREAVFFLNVSAKSGTNPTLDVKIQTKDPISGQWSDLVSFAQAADVTTEMKTVPAGLGSAIAVSYTIAGGSPSFTFSVGAVLK